MFNMSIGHRALKLRVQSYLGLCMLLRLNASASQPIRSTSPKEN